jgi:two-component system, sensor histidine kinase
MDTMAKADKPMNSAPAGAAQSDARPPAPSHARPQGGRILLASSDPQLIAAAEPVLAAAGYQVTVVASGPEVLLHIDDRGADIYLLDHALPTMNGLRVARHLRQGYNVSRERIIVLYPAQLPASYQAEIQASEVLITPFTGVELLLCVMRHLEQC